MTEFSAVPRFSNKPSNFAKNKPQNCVSTTAAAAGQRRDATGLLLLAEGGGEGLAFFAEKVCREFT